MIVGFFMLILGVLLGLYAGYRFTAAELEAAKKGQHIDYKQRWLEAVKLLQDEEKITPEQLKEITALPTGQGGKPARVEADTNHGRFTAYQQMLLTLPPGAREDEEENRLEHGQAPVDPLTNLPPGVFVDMMQRRREYGYFND
jgi:hypothetical protein